MSHPAITCRAADALTGVEQLMNEHKISRVVVTDEDGALEGVVSLADVVQFEGVRRTAALVRSLMSRETHF